MHRYTTFPRLRGCTLRRSLEKLVAECRGRHGAHRPEVGPLKILVVDPTALPVWIDLSSFSPADLAACQPVSDLIAVAFPSVFHESADAADYPLLPVTDGPVDGGAVLFKIFPDSGQPLVGVSCRVGVWDEQRIPVQFRVVEVPYQIFPVRRLKRGQGDAVVDQDACFHKSNVYNYLVHCDLSYL